MPARPHGRRVGPGLSNRSPRLFAALPVLSLGRNAPARRKCDLAWGDLVAYGEGLIAVLVPNNADEDCALRLRRYAKPSATELYMRLSLAPPPQ